MPFSCPDDLTNEEIVPRLRAQRYRQVPIYGETPDDIVGILDVRVFLSTPEEHYTELLNPPSFVPETMKALDLLRSFLRRAQPLAIVVDEHGGTEGVIALRDVVEEIISDAVPLPIASSTSSPWATAASSSMAAPGSMTSTNSSARSSRRRASTPSAASFSTGSAPSRSPGTEVQIDGVRVTVRRTSRKRLEELLVAVAPPAAGVQRRRRPVMTCARHPRLLAVSFVFSGIEAGILSVNRVRLRHRVKMRDRAAIRLKELLVSPERFLVTVLVVTNLMNISAIALATQSLVQWLGVRGYFAAFAHLPAGESLPAGGAAEVDLPPLPLSRAGHPGRAAAPRRCAPHADAFPRLAAHQPDLRPAPRRTGKSSSSAARTSNTSPPKASAWARSRRTSAR